MIYTNFSSSSQNFHIVTDISKSSSNSTNFQDCVDSRSKSKINSKKLCISKTWGNYVRDKYSNSWIQRKICNASHLRKLFLGPQRSILSKNQNLPGKLEQQSAICWNSLGLFRDYSLNYIFFFGTKLFCFPR